MKKRKVLSRTRPLARGGDFAKQNTKIEIRTSQIRGFFMAKERKEHNKKYVR